MLPAEKRSIKFDVRTTSLKKMERTINHDSRSRVFACLHTFLKAKTKFPFYLYLLILCSNQFLNFPFLTIL